MRLLPFSLILAACAWLLTGAACNPKLLVPPARLMGGESPAVLPRGDLSAGISGSQIHKAEFLESSNDFAARLVMADLSAGLGYGLDARLIGTAAFMETPKDGEDSPDYFAEAGLERDLRAIALRLKWNPAKSKFFAFSGGGGYGSWAGRGYYSMEGALIAGFENPYFVPFFNLRYAYNVPVRRDSVRWADSPEWDSYAKYTRPSRAQEAILGFKVPLVRHEGAKRGAYGNPPYLTLEFGILDITDRKDAFTGSTLAAGFHFPLRRTGK